jgi:prepilin-type N-terminal cleavage/methylation domain-containing protein
MKRTKSSGFTLVELLAVIVILSLLVALLLPAIGSAIKSAKAAAVSAEINTLAQSLADFRSKYGDYPPSRIILVENGDYSSTNLNYAGQSFASPNSQDLYTGQLAQRSMSYLRKFFPRIQLSSSGPVFTSPYTQGWYDFNGNSATTTVPDGPKLLTGDECLVFFLGGLPTVSTSGGVTTWGMTGFSKNPANPFLPTSLSPANRVNPMFEFRSDQIVDIDGDGYPSYLDSLKTNRPYIYFSSYGGSGYDPNDANYDTGSPAIESDAAGVTSPITLKFQVNFPTSLSVGTKNYEVSPPPNPYSNSPTATGTSPVIWQNPQSFQIISAGADGQYGIGGIYTPSSDEALPVDSTNTTPSTDATLRQREKDNLTSFATGKLD